MCIAIARRYVKVVMLLFLATLVGACNGGAEFATQPEKVRSFLGHTNSRVLEKGNLVIYSRGNKDIYSVLRLGTPDALFDGSPRLFISIQGMPPLDLSRPDIVRVLRGSIPSPVPGPTLRLSQYDPISNEVEFWPEGTERMQFNDYVFYVLDDALVGFEIMGEARNLLAEEYVRDPRSPRIGTNETNIILFPFDAGAYRTSFGEPDRVYELYHQ
ncbi:MAG: hypothetical protein RLZZ227_1397 [Pseudomonadota bacterium]|jgi:hypothetical protein